MWRWLPGFPWPVAAMHAYRARLGMAGCPMTSVAPTAASCFLELRRELHYDEKMGWQVQLLDLRRLARSFHLHHPPHSCSSPIPILPSGSPVQDENLHRRFPLLLRLPGGRPNLHQLQSLDSMYGGIHSGMGRVMLTRLSLSGRSSIRQIHDL
jgi:hypothetical protein